MPKWKNNAIDLYRALTRASRALSVRQMKRRGQLPIYVVFYHRIANTHLNDWTMTTAKFQQQMEWLQSNFDMVDLAECQRRIRSGHNDRPTVSVTFDDGYAENGEFAIPYLIDHGIPTTYFVTTHHTVNQERFGHDADRDQPLPTNTIDTLRAYAAAGIEIGAHSRTHFDMGQAVDPGRIVDEVLTATREMELLIGRRIRYFAFPYGQRANLNAVVFQLLKENGIKGVCSAYGGSNEIGGDAFHLQRVHGDPVFARLRNHLNFDPRQARIGGYDYSIDENSEAAERLRVCRELAKKLGKQPLLPSVNAGPSQLSGEDDSLRATSWPVPLSPTDPLPAFPPTETPNQS